MQWPDGNSERSLVAMDRLVLLRGAALLRDLEQWRPVGAMLEDVRLALHGDGGMTQGEVDRMLTWGTCWRRLDKRLKALYRPSGDSTESYPSRSVEAALWAVMGVNGPVSGPTYGALRRLWVDRYGYPPPIEVAPLPKEIR